MEETQLKKNRKDIHHISKPIRIKNKLQNRENQDPHHNIEVKVIRAHKVTVHSDGPLSLFCKEKIFKHAKKSRKFQSRESYAESDLICTFSHM